MVSFRKIIMCDKSKKSNLVWFSNEKCKYVTCNPHNDTYLREYKEEL